MIAALAREGFFITGFLLAIEKLSASGGHSLPAVFLPLLLILAAPLYLAALGQPPLWQDEATTALLARHVLATGLPTVGHGPDSASQDRDDKRAWGDVDVTLPWMQTYLAALGIAASGVDGPAEDMGQVRRLSAWARLPFAVCALLTVLILYRIVYDALGEGPAADARWARWVALSAAAITLGCPLFVLSARQCRYYAPTALAVTLVVLAYLRMRRDRRWRVTALAAASVLLVLTNDLVWLGVCAALVLHWAAIERRHVRAPRMLAAFVPGLAVGIAWFLLCATASRYGRVHLAGMPFVLGAYLLETNAHVFPAILLPVGLLLWWDRLGLGSGEGVARRAWRAAGEAGHPLRLGLLLLLVGAAVAMAHAPLRSVYPRYLAPAVAPLAAVSALLLVPRSASRRTGLLSAALVAAVALTDAAGLLSDAPLRVGDFRPARKHASWTRPRAAPELMGFFSAPAPGPVSGVLEYLFANAAPGEVLVTTYGDQPLAFFTPLRVYGGLSGEVPDPDVVTWAWPRASTTPNPRTKRGHAGWWIANRLDLDRFERIVLPVPDRRWEFRPDPDYLWTMEDAGVPQVVLYRRIRR